MKGTVLRRDDCRQPARRATRAEHDAVVSAAWMALGVLDVRDELQVACQGRADRLAARWDWTY
ncbi:hypothetical protein EAS64_25890 [Trebonia kvetii]|uniref:Uncharacterized protein n=1 Tax=Trebonia kvetii TaxID=2480626 RepID=A0A6P2BVJ6_9ACTN|nr:hypothetical protein [Trebonia kvetii]TVZ02256.1 hypothetical protein EAS64_25890 [Trebonia kvetii]